ncbi:MAG: hypothetical protein C5B58_00715 [Acidobacteria bacterium]|nr:MAG: hypothetical protein C5B58_00715 [Acidobacteriota bacterium]
MAVLFATGSSPRHRSGNRASGLFCGSKSLKAIPAIRSEVASGPRIAAAAMLTAWTSFLAEGERLASCQRSHLAEIRNQD